MKLPKQYLQLGCTNLLLLSVGGYAVYAQSYEMLFSVFLMLVVSLTPYYLKGTHNIHIPITFIYAAILFIFMSVFLGQFGGLYDRLPWWDAFLHLISAITFGFVGFILLYVYYVHNQIKIPRGVILTFAFFFSLGVGGMWEIIEYAIDLTLGTNMQVGSLDDTMIDLILGAVGGLIATIMCALYLSKFNTPIIDTIVEAMTEEVIEENKAPAIAVINEMTPTS
mgnify:CR=1 FL=1